MVSDRSNAVQANVQQIRDLESRYPGRLRLIRSGGEVEALDMDRLMQAGMPRTFDNSDPAMPQYVSTSLSEGKQVAIIPVGREKLMVCAAHSLFSGR